MAGRTPAGGNRDTTSTVALPRISADVLDKLVSATGYSENLEFMTPGNSTLLGYRKEPVHPRDWIEMVTSTMKWAYPEEDVLAEWLLWLYEVRHDGALKDRTVRPGYTPLREA
jgi:hypothetical protein